MARAKKRSDGRYRVTLTVGKDYNGKPIRKEFYSRVSITDARNQRNEYMRTHNFGGDGVPTPKYDGTIRLETWVASWLDSYKANLAPNTFDQYRHVSNRFCNFIADGTRYGDRPINSFLPMHLTVYMQSMSGMSKSSIRSAKMTISQIFSAAKANGMIDRDLTADLTETVAKQKVQGTYSGHKALPREYIDFINQNYQHHRLGVFVMTMIWAGLRPGEASALTWDDIDFEKGVIHVTKSLDLKHGGVFKDTKTETGNRDVPLFAPLRKALFRAERNSSFVFARVNGEHYNYKSLSDAFENFCGAIERVINGVPSPWNAQGFRKDKWIEKHGEWKTFDFSLYDLRDTFCTTLYDAQVDLKTAQKLMGHRDPSTTLKIYTKLSEQRESDSVEAMNDFIQRMYM